MYKRQEQADALAKFAVGKNVEELKNGAIDETGKAPEVSDLASTATIYLGGYVSAIEEAVNNADYIGAQAGDQLKLASLSSIDSSQNASEEQEGTAQLDCDVTALTPVSYTHLYYHSVVCRCNVSAHSAEFGNHCAYTVGFFNL